MLQIFDSSWEKLTAESVERFLADAGDEGLSWEAKAEVPRRESVQKAVSGFANSLGGYLIVGAVRRAAREPGWDLPGTRFTVEEPATWMTQLIAPHGVSPLPRFDVKELERGDGRSVVIVQVDQADAPPCVTSSGIVYQRVSGATNPVTDQGVLTTLIHQGQAARVRAADVALQAARHVLSQPGNPNAGDALFAVGVCALGGPADRASVLFELSRAQRFWDIVEERLHPDPAWRSGGNHASAHQDHLRAWTASDSARQCNTAVAFWDGAAAIGFTAADAERDLDRITQHVGHFWRVLVDVVQLFDGFGDAHLAVAFGPRPHKDEGTMRPWPRTDVRRWVRIAPPTEAQLASVTREIERGLGRMSWEPEPASG